MANSDLFSLAQQTKGPLCSRHFVVPAISLVAVVRIGLITIPELRLSCLVTLSTQVPVMTNFIEVNQLPLFVNFNSRAICRFFSLGN